MKAWAPNGRDVVDWPGSDVARGYAIDDQTDEQRKQSAERCSRVKPWTYRKRAKGAAKASKREEP